MAKRAGGGHAQLTAVVDWLSKHQWAVKWPVVQVMLKMACVIQHDAFRDTYIWTVHDVYGAWLWRWGCVLVGHWDAWCQCLWHLCIVYSLQRLYHRPNTWLWKPGPQLCDQVENCCKFGFFRDWNIDHKILWSEDKQLSLAGYLLQSSGQILQSQIARSCSNRGVTISIWSVSWPELSRWSGTQSKAFSSVLTWSGAEPILLTHWQMLFVALDV